MEKEALVMAKIPRRELSIAEKIALLDQIQNMPSKISARRLSEMTGVPKSTLARLISQKDKLRELWTKRKDLGWTKKRKREGKDPDVEDALAKWFAMVSKDNVQVNGPMLKAKAVDLAQQLGHMEFKATDGWLSRWKSRHNIKLKKITCTDNTNLNYNTSTDEILSPEQWTLIKLPYLLNEFCSMDIYNVGETLLFYNATPDGNLQFDNTLLRTDHVTILCCSNISGCDKRKLCIVGQSPTSRCFHGLSNESLPIVYFYNDKLSAEIFKEWLQNWDMELQWQSRKVILLLRLNKFLIDPELDSLQNIQFEFLPISQPMDLGILSNLKKIYRTRLVHYILEAIEENVLNVNSTAEEVSSKLTFLQAMQFLADSWRQLSTELIQNCFVKCGIRHPDCEIDIDATAFENTENEIINLPKVKDDKQLTIKKLENDEDTTEDVLSEDQLKMNQTARKSIDTEATAIEITEKDNDDKQPIIVKQQKGEDVTEDVLSELITNQTAKKSIDAEATGIKNTGKETIIDLRKVKNYQEFVNMDDKQLIIKKQENDEDVTEHILSEEQLITNQTARKSIADLRRYFMQNGNEESPLAALDLCADFVHLQSFKRMRQTPSNNYFKEESG